VAFAPMIRGGLLDAYLNPLPLLELLMVFDHPEWHRI
jgi:hypothetical protein